MNAAGDYSAAYAILKTDSEFQGHGMVSPFSIKIARCMKITGFP